MKKRILAIICIMFLLFTATTPFAGGVFSYADEPQQEQLSQDEVIKAAIALYLNERKAWITSTTSAPIDAVQAQMQNWIDSYDFWTNHTTIGSAAAFYAQCIVRYNPFRISLKGPAVRALNDLYNWLIDTGKLPNLDSDSTGGETNDPLYKGLISNNSLYYTATIPSYGDAATANQFFMFNLSDVTLGNPVRGATGNIIVDAFCRYNSISLSDFNDISNTTTTYRELSQTFQYFSNVSETRSFSRSFAYGGSASVQSMLPYLAFSNPASSGSDFSNMNDPIYMGQLKNVVYANRNHVVRGNPAYVTLVYNGVARSFCGYATIDYNSNKIILSTRSQITVSGNSNVSSVQVNLETDNFNKTDPTPPEGDNEVTYTPEDKTTGNTYNTYNEYISNYVTKNTVVNNNNSGGGGSDPDEPETPGGTTPPWDNSSGAGTLTPDGNGGYNFNLPDLTLPDLNIDWSINGLKDKFPFSIPWDLMAFFTVLNAEPETPSIQADIDLGIVDWEIDWDFHNFDTLAALLRNLEFIGFCLALLLITRSIIKG